MHHSLCRRIPTPSSDDTLTSDAAAQLWPFILTEHSCMQLLVACHNVLSALLDMHHSLCRSFPTKSSDDTLTVTRRRGCPALACMQLAVVGCHHIPSALLTSVTCIITAFVGAFLRLFRHSDMTCSHSYTTL